MECTMERIMILMNFKKNKEQRRGVDKKGKRIWEKIGLGGKSTRCKDGANIKTHKSTSSGRN